MPFGHMFATHIRHQLKELYISIGIFSFAASLITIFEPIFLYQHGFPIWAIALYYAIHYALYVVLLPVGGKVASQYGLEKSIVFSLPFFILYFVSLAIIPSFPLAILGVIMFLTLHKILYWPAYYAIFARFSDSNNRGTELSWLGVFHYGATIGGPAIGGFIATVWGFPALFLSAGALVLFSGIPLIAVKQVYGKSDFSYKSPWEMLFRIEYRKTFIATLGWGENLIDVVFWPLFLFFVLGSLDSLGIYMSISLVVMTLMGFYIGKSADHQKRATVLRTYLPFMAIDYIFRIFAVTPVRIIFTDSIARVSQIGVVLPMMYKIYSQAKGTASLEFMVAFEIVLAIAKAGTAVLIMLLFILLPMQAAFIATFCLGMVLSLFYSRV
ncbi:MAG: MFS transporter [bacterium]|nr:MFS transporter [bacterium]